MGVTLIRGGGGDDADPTPHVHHHPDMRHTKKSGGVFRVKLCISSEYPRTPPLAHCETRVWHPNISAQGDICVNTLKRDWTPTTTLTHVLQVCACLMVLVRGRRGGATTASSTESRIHLLITTNHGT